MAKRRDLDLIDRTQNESHINIQKFNNGIFADLTHIAKENGQSLPTYLKRFLRELRDKNIILLQKPRID